MGWMAWYIVTWYKSRAWLPGMSNQSIYFIGFIKLIQRRLILGSEKWKWTLWLWHINKHTELFLRSMEVFTDCWYLDLNLRYWAFKDWQHSSHFVYSITKSSRWNMSALWPNINLTKVLRDKWVKLEWENEIGLFRTPTTTWIKSSAI